MENQEGAPLKSGVPSFCPLGAGYSRMVSQVFAVHFVMLFLRSGRCQQVKMLTLPPEFPVAEILPSTDQDTHRRFVNQKMKKVEGLCHLTEPLSRSWSFFSRFPCKGGRDGSKRHSRQEPSSDTAALDTP